MSSTSERHPSADTSATMTAAPSRASVRTNARPTPPAPPVTIATLSKNFTSCSFHGEAVIRIGVARSRGRQVLVVRCVAQNLHTTGGHEDLLLQLQTLVLALDPHVRLHAQHHPVLDLAGVVVGEGDHRVLVGQ